MSKRPAHNTRPSAQPSDAGLLQANYAIGAVNRPAHHGGAPLDVRQGGALLSRTLAVRDDGLSHQYEDGSDARARCVVNGAIRRAQVCRHKLTGDYDRFALPSRGVYGNIECCQQPIADGRRHCLLGTGVRPYPRCQRKTHRQCPHHLPPLTKAAKQPSPLLRPRKPLTSETARGSSDQHPAIKVQGPHAHVLGASLTRWSLTSAEMTKAGREAHAEITRAAA